MIASNPIADAIRDHLAASRLSARALSLEAGLSENVVGYALSGRTARPKAEVLAALSRVMGLDLTALPDATEATVADARAFLRASPVGWSPSRLRGAASALSCYAGASCVDEGGVAFTRGAVRTFLTKSSPASLAIAPGTYAAYASHLRALLDAMGGGRRRMRIDDLTGPWRALHDRAAALDIPDSLAHAAGAFCVWCAAEGLHLGDIGSEVFARYLEHRMRAGRITVGEAEHRTAARKAWAWWRRVAAAPELADLGLAEVAVRPFPDGRRRHGDAAEPVEALLHEYDRRVVPWLKGLAAPDGRLVKKILDGLDAETIAPVGGAKAAARRFAGAQSRSRREARADRLRADGVLLPGATWCDRRIANIRAAIASLARVFHERTGVIIGGLEELTDLEILDAAATALDEANDDPTGLGSTYIARTIRALRKIARDYVRRPKVEIDALRALEIDFDPDFAGVAPRNRRKLEAFSKERLERFFRMSDELVGEMNAEIARRRAEIRRAEAEGRERPALVDADLARCHRLVVAHDILTTRAPRKANLLCIDLAEHVRQNGDGCIVIELPAHLVKAKVALKIVLSPRKTRRFLQYVKASRPALLTDETNASTLLFPSLSHPDRPSRTLLPQLIDEIEARIGVRIHPHLYRHLIGWVWLRKDRRNLPKVQIVLGHKKIATTQKFYCELDQDLAQQDWSDFLEETADVDDRQAA